MQALSRLGKTEVLTSSHRPYGSNKVSLQEIKRIKEAGGWVCFSFQNSHLVFVLSGWESEVLLLYKKEMLFSKSFGGMNHEKSLYVKTLIGNNIVIHSAILYLQVYVNPLKNIFFPNLFIIKNKLPIWPLSYCWKFILALLPIGKLKETNGRANLKQFNSLRSIFFEGQFSPIVEGWNR